MYGTGVLYKRTHSIKTHSKATNKYFCGFGITLYGSILMEEVCFGALCNDIGSSLNAVRRKRIHKLLMQR